MAKIDDELSKDATDQAIEDLEYNEYLHWLSQLSDERKKEVEDYIKENGSYYLYWIDHRHIDSI